jgi:hypothetical protein
LNSAHPIVRSLCLLLCIVALALQPVQAQRVPFRGATAPTNGLPPANPEGNEFHFVRLIYSDYSAGGRGGGFRSRGSWTTDWPEAEHFFMEGLTRLTLVDGAKASVFDGEGGERLTLDDDSIFDYPFLYAVEVGHWSLNADEIAKLREYLLRGGFLLVDDFHGTQEWGVFIATMQRVFPDRPIVEIPDDAEVLHVVYDLDKTVQIPGLAALYNGVTYEYDGYDPDWRGIFDDKGRLLVAINHNMDMGDAWENADLPAYPEPMTALAYRFAVNYAIYAMTH